MDRRSAWALATSTEALLNSASPAIASRDLPWRLRSMFYREMSPVGGFDVGPRSVDIRKVRMAGQGLAFNLPPVPSLFYWRDDDRLWENIVLKGLETLELKRLNSLELDAAMTRPWLVSGLSI